MADPKNVSPMMRLKDYPNEQLKVLNKKLFCSACRETISLKKSVIDLHIKSSKHSKGKARLASKEKREGDIISMLKKYDKDVHPVSEGLSEEVRAYRVKVVTAFLKAGVPLNKVDCFRDLLEEHAFSLTNSHHMTELIPVIHQEQQSMIKSQIYGKQVSLIFDGTTHVAEAMVIILRFIDDEWIIHQRVVRLMLLAKSMTGQEVARQLISTYPLNLEFALTCL